MLLHIPMLLHSYHMLHTLFLLYFVLHYLHMHFHFRLPYNMNYYRFYLLLHFFRIYSYSSMLLLPIRRFSSYGYLMFYCNLSSLYIYYLLLHFSNFVLLALLLFFHYHYLLQILLPIDHLLLFHS